MKPILLCQSLDLRDVTQFAPPPLHRWLQELIRAGSGTAMLASGRRLTIEVACDARMTYLCLLADPRPVAELVLVDSPQESRSTWIWFRERLQQLSCSGPEEIPDDPPPPLPWMGVLVWPGMVSLTGHEIAAITILQRHLGIVLLDGHRPRPSRSPRDLIDQFPPHPSR